MLKDNIIVLREASQQYAYTSLQMHETTARRAGFAGTDHKYLGFFLQRGTLSAGELAILTGLTTRQVQDMKQHLERLKEQGINSLNDQME